MSAKYYELRYMSSKLVHLLDTALKLTLMLVSGLKEQLIKSKPTWKLKPANGILESFEQTSSKSILIISSYNVSKFAPFLRHSV